MKRISAYQATDGKIYNDKGDCKTHQKGLDIVAAVTAICKGIDNDEAYYSDDAGHHLLTSETAVLFILNNAESIQAALKGKIEVATVVTQES